MTLKEIEERKAELLNKIAEAKNQEELEELRNEVEAINKEVPDQEEKVEEKPEEISKEEERDLIADTTELEKRSVNTLVITFNIALLKQWKIRLKQFLDIEEIGQIGDSKNTLTNKIDVASIKTIYNNGKFSDIVKNY